MITYAQNFEDVLLARLFAGRRTGFYIDVGAWHPITHSVTQHFYNLGWRGINIEPIGGQYKLFKKARPRDINLNIAAGAASSRLTFFECSDLTSLSTFSVSQARQLRKDGHTVVERMVELRSLTEIIAENNCPDVDFLKIDVEGFEASVIRGMNFERYRPRILVIEATLPARQITDWDNVDSVRNWDEWEPLLLKSGYVFAHFDGLSRFYLCSEDAALAKRLQIPPGVHDELEFPQVLSQRSEIDALLNERAAKEQVVSKLLQEIDLLKVDREKTLDANERVAAENERLQLQIPLAVADESQSAQVLSLRKEIDALHADRKAKEEVIDRLLGEIDLVNAGRTEMLETNTRIATQFDALLADRAAKEGVVARLLEEIDLLKASRMEILETNARLATEIEVLSTDRAEKGEVVRRLLKEIDLLKASRAEILEVNARLAGESEVLARHRSEKEQVVGRLMEEIDLLKAGREDMLQANLRLAGEIAALSADRAEKEEVVIRLLGEVDLLKEGRAELLEANVRVSAEMKAVLTDRAAKEDVITRLLGDIDLLNAGRTELLEASSRNAGRVETLLEDVAVKQQLIVKFHEEVDLLKSGRIEMLKTSARVATENEQRHQKMSGLNSELGLENHRLSERLRAALSEIQSAMLRGDLLASELAVMEKKSIELSDRSQFAEAEALEYKSDIQHLAADLAKTHESLTNLELKIGEAHRRNASFEAEISAGALINQTLSAKLEREVTSFPS